MPKLVLVGVPLLHGMVTGRLGNLAAGVISRMTTRSMETLLVVTFAITLVQKAGARDGIEPAIQTQILLIARSSREGEPYQSCPSGQPGAMDGVAREKNAVIGLSTKRTIANGLTINAPLTTEGEVHDEQA